MSRLALAILLLVTTPALAQTPGTCAPGTAEADLDVGDVFARAFNTGNLFWGNSTPPGGGYIVPKTSGLAPLYAVDMWVSGLIGNDIRAAGAYFSGFEFWPGPLEPGATLPDPDDCSTYDRIWIVDALDVQHFDATGEATADLAEWPVALGAPVVDGDGVEGNYDLEAGDRPAVYGHQVAFWVLNDVGNVHETFGTAPIGLEVRVTAFASAEAALDQQTFYRYEFVNRNDEPFEAARFGLFVGPQFSDNFVGSDSTRGLAFAYNSDNTEIGYGTPPAAGLDILSGAATATFLVNAPCSATSDPCTAEQLYHRLQGFWNDGTPITEGGIGYKADGATVPWMFPGDPVTEQFWSEVNTDGSGADNYFGQRKYTMSSPPFTLNPGESRVFDLAVLFGQGADHLDSITALRAVSDAVQARYDDGELFAPSTVAVAAENGAAAPTVARLDAVHPNPVRDHATVAFSVAVAGPVRLTVHDVLGRRVRMLVEGPTAAGDHRTTFDADGLASGVYFVVLEVDGQRATRKVMIVR